MFLRETSGGLRGLLVPCGRCSFTAVLRSMPLVGGLKGGFKRQVRVIWGVMAVYRSGASVLWQAALQMTCAGAQTHPRASDLPGFHSTW